MARTVLGVVVGYVVMAVFVMVAFTAAYWILGSEAAFQRGSYQVTGLWIGLSFALGFAGALIGGCVCSVIARNRRAPMALAGFVLVLGLILAVPVLQVPEAARQRVREAEVGNFEAMQNAVQPGWVAVLNPFVGALGVVVGAGLRRREPDEPALP